MFPARSRLALKHRHPIEPLSLDFWQSADARIEFALFEDASDVLVTDFSNLGPINLEVRVGITGGGSIIIRPDPIDIGTLNQTLALNDWNAGTNQHGTFYLTAAIMAQVVPLKILDCWITIYSKTLSAGLIVHGAGAFRLHRNRAADALTPPPPIGDIPDGSVDVGDGTITDMGDGTIVTEA